MNPSDEQGTGIVVVPVHDGQLRALGASFLSGDVMTRYWGTGETLLSADRKKSRKKKPAKKKTTRKKPRRPARKVTKSGPGCVTDAQTCTCSNGCGNSNGDGC
jgi:hypothetical protein